MGRRRAAAWALRGVGLLLALSGRSAQQCADCGPKCITTKVAKPMRGECAGPTPTQFYIGDTVRQDDPLWRVQHLPLRVCVKGIDEANVRAQQAVNRLVQIAGVLWDLTDADVQDTCRARWRDIVLPPPFFNACNDPAATEEIQIAGFTNDADFAPHLQDLKAAIAQALMTLIIGTSDMNVVASDVTVLSVKGGQACTTGDAGCTKLLTGLGAGIRVRVVLRRPQDDVDRLDQIDQIFHGTDIFSATLATNMQARLGTFNEIAMTSGRDSTLCSGVKDTTTCLMGAICGPVTLRTAFTNFTTTNWWSRADKKWFGGNVPARARLREWYCDNDPRLYIGKVKNGQKGTSDYYQQSANPNVKSECDDYVHTPTTPSGSPSGEPPSGGDQQCAGVNFTDPVPADCCGYCFLSNIHLMELYNCSYMQDPLVNDMLVNTLAEYCLKTQICRQERPCFGDPVFMDPDTMLRSKSFDTYCDPLDRGCGTPYVDARPVKPGEKACGYSDVCDFSIDTLRSHVGYHWSEINLQPTDPGPGYDPGALAGGLIALLVVIGIVAFFLRRRHLRLQAIREKKERKARARYESKRARVTGVDI